MSHRPKNANRRLNLADVAGVHFIRPSDEIVSRLRQECHSYVLQQFRPYEYTDPSDVNAVVQRAYDFYSVRLERIVAAVASRDFIQLLLHQYDESARVTHGNLRNESSQRGWNHDWQRFRRALKYLCEVTVKVAKRADSALPQRKAIKLCEQALSCAEEMVELYHHSEIVFSLVPENVRFNLATDYTKSRLICPSASLFAKFQAVVETDRVVQNQL